MRTHKEIIDEGISDALKKHGGFWAFSDKQVREQGVEGVEYVSLGAGLICPKGKGKAIMAAIDAAVEKGQKHRLATESREEIIRYELGNYECFYTGDISDAVEALADYGITEDEVRAVFRAEQQRRSARLAN